MTRMKIANWNIEWMNRWFTGDNDGAPRWKPSAEIAGVSDIEALANRIGGVIEALGADIVTLQEGPSRRAEMALFVRDCLGDRYEIVGPAGQGQQKLYALVARDSDAVADVSRIGAELGVDFEDTWEVDIDADLDLDAYRFTRAPLAMRVETATGRSLRLVSLHAKSKFVHGGEAMWRDPARRLDFVKAALEARRRISAEAMRVREYLNACFEEDEAAAIVVTGDFNDGPGTDYFERHYLTHNVAGMIAGSPFAPRRMLRHAFIDVMEKEKNYTVVFDDFIDEIRNRKILLDHIFVSPSLYWGADGAVSAEGTVEHAVFEAGIDAGAPAGSRQRMPSDHRPQSVTLEV